MGRYVDGPGPDRSTHPNVTIPLQAETLIERHGWHSALNAAREEIHAATLRADRLYWSKVRNYILEVE